MGKIKNFFKVNSNYQLLIINIVFCVTGATALFVVDYFLDLFSINYQKDGAFIYWFLRIIFIIPVYQVFLIIYGTIFGEFSYFNEMQKKTLRKIFAIFKKK